LRELNYQPNWIARSMMTGHTYLVGLVLPDLMHSFFAEIANRVARKQQPLGYHVMILNTEEDAEVEQSNIEAMMARKVDGLIIASAQRRGRARLFERLEATRVPFVLIGREAGNGKSNYVGIKDEDIGIKLIYCPGFFNKTATNSGSDAANTFFGT
jgi:LacI family transcriptional regulator